jgi:predicted DCC family thiol-disulfide oxidoreductase YuxK
MPDQYIKLLYDGQCPFCRREVQWLKGKDRDGRLEIEDISDPAFDPARYGLTRPAVEAEIHGVLPDGKIVRRVEAIRRAYRAVGLGWLVWPTRLPAISWVLDRLYRLFARHRAGLGRWFGRR